ncbi:hypothetical protein [Reinekea sp. G2M2-21]|uniref:hypothetical protein n=1 Tax=Reinekea sp. G2M2-21 TaxID=2788942 RepID=UPI0018AC29BF|nr:hypothetical protein [Reinekea sp. G2M2-21]
MLSGLVGNRSTPASQHFIISSFHHFIIILTPDLITVYLTIEGALQRLLADNAFALAKVQLETAVTLKLHNDCTAQACASVGWPH